jgi:hypothetical protein
VSSAFGELIGQLEALKGQIEASSAQMVGVTGRDQLVPEVYSAKGEMEAALGQIPLPMDHPQWANISGAIMAAMGSIDGFIDMEQELKQRAHDAVAASQQAVQAVNDAIGGFQAGGS